MKWLLKKMGWMHPSGRINWLEIQFDIVAMILIALGVFLYAMGAK